MAAKKITITANGLLQFIKVNGKHILTVGRINTFPGMDIKLGTLADIAVAFEVANSIRRAHANKN